VAEDKIATLARDQFWDMALSAKERGRDLAEVLDRAGVLLTDSRLRKIKADTIREIADLLGTSSPHKWTQGSTQMHLINDIALGLRKIAEEWEQK
jgi:hypothetical protein